jgi:MFS family permease
VASDTSSPGVHAHVSQSPTAPTPAASAAERVAGGASFAALRHPEYRAYVARSSLSMLADNIEHVISYWVLWQAFQSPMLQGFAVIAHWSPQLLFGVHFGHLADRYDCRRLIQIGQGLFALVSVAWAVLIVTGTLEVWHAVLLLVGHGVAGGLWGPPSQLIIHDIVGGQQLQSAVRLSATLRQFAVLFGPLLGSGMMVAISPAGGLLVNAALYIPLVVWLVRAPYTGHQNVEGRRSAGPGLRWTEAIHVAREVSGNRTIIAMVALGGLSSLLVGNAYQAQMPGFAEGLGTGNAGLAYGVLLGANAVGAFLGGVLLEGTGLLRPNARTAILCTLAWCGTILVFAATRSYLLAVVMLLIGGMLNLAFTSMAQTLVQVLAPPDKRGRVVGLFNTSLHGLRVGSGVTVGVMGSIIGIHWALGISAVVLFVVTLGLLAYARRSDGEPLAVEVRAGGGT